MLFSLTMLMLTPPQDVQPDCDGSTLEINACMGNQFDRANARLEEYVAAAINRHTDPEGNTDSVALGIEASQRAFEAYREIECRALYEDWKDGTIRSMMYLGCQVQLTDERTHTVWQNWLQYMDSTPPILPEPGPTELIP